MTDTKGRPVERGQVKRVTLELPTELWEKITEVSPNRTQWIIKALKAQIEREEKERIQNEINRANYKARIYD